MEIDGDKVKIKLVLDDTDWKKQLQSVIGASQDILGGLYNAFDNLNKNSPKKAFEETANAVGPFSGALKAIPYAQVALGVVDLGLALFDLSGGFKEEKTELQQLAEAAEESTKAHQAMREESALLAKEKAAEFDNYAELKKELDRMVDANGKVKEGYEERAGFITTTLSKATGLEVKMVNGTIENYQELGKEIDKIIEKKKSEALISAYDERYKEAIKGKSDALKKFVEEEAKIEEFRATREQEIAKYKSSQREATDAQAAAAFEMQVKLKEQGLNKIKEEYNGYAQTVTNYEQAVADSVAGNHADIEKTLSGTNAKYASSAEERKKITEKSIIDETAELTLLNERKSTMGEEQYNTEKRRLEDSIEANKQSLKDMTKNVEEAAPLYAEKTGELARGGVMQFDENGNLKEVAEGKIDEVNTALVEKEEGLKVGYAKMAGIGIGAFTENGSLKEIAGEKIDEVNTALIEKEEGLKAGYDIMAGLGANAFNENGDLTEEGKAKLDQLNAAICSKQAELKAAYEELMKKGKEGLSEKGDLTLAGEETINGYKEGVKRKAGALKSQNFMGGIAGDLAKPFKDFLGIKSPSRLFSGFGMWTMKGFETGVDLEGKSTIKVMGTLAKGLSDSFENAMDLDGITPTMKLTSSLKAAKLDELKSMQSNFKQSLDNELFLKAGAPIQNIFNYNFDQTINSANELSPSQIATQTEAMIRRERWSV